MKNKTVEAMDPEQVSKAIGKRIISDLNRL